MAEVPQGGASISTPNANRLPSRAFAWTWGPHLPVHLACTAPVFAMRTAAGLLSLLAICLISARAQGEMLNICTVVLTEELQSLMVIPA